ncbi:MAG: hypothetical protein HYS27_19765 [Deltaproteobacteria bacterium]|nr:hypothetical protein [Deltaproteobacteria bacterium]
MRRTAAPLRVLVASLALPLALPLAVACVERVPIDFVVPKDALAEDFLDTPWPSDLLRTEDGGLDLLRFPNPYASTSLEDVLRLVQLTHGTAASGTLYFHVDGGVDEGSLPEDPAASLSPDAAMFLLETDTLTRIPIEWQHYPEGTSFLPPGTVAVQPLLGAYPRGRYALIVTGAGRAAGGASLAASPDLDRLLRCESIEGEALPPDCTPYAAVVSALGLQPEDVALVQVVTPADARSGLVAAAATTRTFSPVATVRSVRPDDASDGYRTYDGTVTLAQFQAGAPPYDTLDGVSGGFVLGDDGAPVIQRVEDVPFVLTVPRRAQPRDGYCVVVYGHGTGGSLESGLGYEAELAADAGCAMLGISEPLHETRAGFRPGQEEMLTFNFFNPLAGRDNWLQSAMEKVQLVTAVEMLTVPRKLTGGLAPIRFDPQQVSYLGHSQGGITGALFIAVEDRVRGAFLSGAGAGFQASLVEKTEPIEIAAVLRTVLSMPDDDTVDRLHPVIALLQTLVDPADPVNVGDLWRHRHGAVPHLVVSSGLKDTFTPPRCHGALAAAFGLPLAEPVSVPVPVLGLLGIETAPPTLEGNLTTEDGAPLTGGVLQYPEDGHFAIFDNEDAASAVRRFLTTLRAGVPSARVR